MRYILKGYLPAPARVAKLPRGLLQAEQQLAGFNHAALAGFLKVLAGLVNITGVLEKRAEAGAARQDSLVAGMLINVARLLPILLAAETLCVEIAEVVAGLHLSRVAALGK